MQLKKSHIIISGAIYLGIVLLILIVNASISEKFEVEKPKKGEIFEVRKISVEPSNRKKITINPLDDPLAPVIKNSTSKTIKKNTQLTTKEMKDKSSLKVQNEVPLDTKILTQ